MPEQQKRLKVLADRIKSNAARLAKKRGGHLTIGCIGENHAHVAIFGNPEKIHHICMVQGSVPPKHQEERFGTPKMFIVSRTFAMAEIRA